jgi:hypothetical protein
MPKNATFLTSQQASEVREPYLSTDSSLGLSEDTHNTNTLLAFGLDAPKQFYDQWFGSEYQPVTEQGLNASIPLDYPAINDSRIQVLNNPPLHLHLGEQAQLHQRNNTLTYCETFETPDSHQELRNLGEPRVCTV